MKKIIISLFIFYCSVFSQTNVSGVISSNTTWTLANSPYIVTGNILLNQNVTLTIEAGVNVQFDSDKVFQVKGTLIARGTASSKIKFTSNATNPAAGDWGYLQFFDESTDASYSNGVYTSGSIMEYCILEYGSGLYITKSGPFINYCEFRYNSEFGVSVYNDDWNSPTELVWITQSDIHNNTVGVKSYSTSTDRAVFNYNTIYSNNPKGGVDASYGTTFSYNTIRNNSYTEQYSDRVAGGIYSDRCNIHNNTIVQNSSTEGEDVGGLYIESGGSITNNVISNNTGDYAVYIDNNLPDSFTNNIIANGLTYFEDEEMGGAYTNNIFAGGLIGEIEFERNESSFTNNSILNSPGDGYYDKLRIYGNDDNNYLNQNVYFSKNLFFNNSSGYYVELSSSGSGQTYLLTTLNNIINNDSIYFKAGSDNSSVENNWWGTTIESEIQNLIYDWNEDATLGFLDYDPYLTAPNTDAPISPPINVVKQTSGNSILITWTANPESDVAGYKVHHGNFNGYSYGTSVDAGNVTSYTLSGVGIDSSISVTSYDSDADGNNDQVEGHQSWFAVASPPPNPPTNLTSSYAGATSIDLSWTASTSSNISKYLIYRSTSANATTLLDSTSGIATYTSTGLTHGLKYYYRVKAVNSDDIRSDYSNETSTLLATRINVPTDYSSIQAGLTAAGTSDTVLVQPGTYTENIIWPETNGIKLISAGDSSNTIIDGGGTSSVIYMNPQTATIDTATLIQGFKITNGGGVTNGGGIFTMNSSIILNELNISENLSNSQGGACYFKGDGEDIAQGYFSSHFIKINNSTIKSNSCSEKGGGVFASEINVIINNSNILSNSQTATSGYNGGGGIYFQRGKMTLRNNLIKLNTAYQGGGIYNNNSDITSQGDTISFNQTFQSGGGGWITTGGSDDTLLISNLTLSNNMAVGGGGGMEQAGGSTLVMENSFIINNLTQKWGGGFYITSGDNTFNNVLITNNTANIDGGAIRLYAGIVEINSSKITNNKTSGEVGGFWSEASSTFSNVTIANNQGNGFKGSGTLNTSTIFSNTGLGLDGQPTIAYSNILKNGIGYNNYDNSNYGNANNNYWGHSSGPYHPTQNSSGQGDSVNIFVNVNPWLTVPNTDAPPIPAQNTTVTGTGNDFISLKWDASPLGDLAGYKLYYDSDSSGYPYTNSVDIGTDTSYTLSSLILGTTFYLAVTTYDTDGNESWYSNEVTGTTRVMQAQNLDVGGDEDLQHMVSHTPSITFRYYDSANETQTTYQIQVSTHSDYSSADMWDSGTITSSDTSATYAGTTLEDGVTYYARVKVGAGTFYSSWSNLSFRMNTKPTTPVLVSPINNQVSSTPVVLRVLNASDAENDAITYSYNVYANNDYGNTSGFNSNALDSSTGVAEGTDTTSWQVTATLPDNVNYFWTVATNDGYEESAELDTGFFMLNSINDAPSEFALLSPSDSAEVTTLTPRLDWQSAVDVDPIDTVKYTIYYGTMIQDLQMVLVDTATVFQVSTPLSDNTTYFWKVVANDLIGATSENTGGYHSFRVNTANDLPGDFALLSPENGSMVTDLTPTLHWEEPDDPDDGRSDSGVNPLRTEILSNDGTNSRSITSYYVYVDTISSLTGVIPDTVATNSYTPTVNLLEDALYYWKVVAVDDDGGLTSSAIWTFWTNSENSAPSVFTLLTPTEDEETSLTPTFSWNISSDLDLYDSISYTLRYGSDPTNLMDVSTENNLTHTPANELTDNTSYLWQVIAEDQSGATYTTDLQSFTVNSENDNPEGLELLNPADGVLITELPMVVVWTPVTDLDGDSIWYDVHLSFSRDIIGTTTNNYFVIDSLGEDAEYFLMVTASDNNGGYLESAEHVINVNFENTPPDSFELLIPEDGEVLTSTTVTFDWNHASDPDPLDSVTYFIHVEADTLSWVYQITPNLSEQTILTPTETFPDNMEYRWSVVAADEYGGVTENTGGPRIFVINTVNDPPSAVTLVAPLNGSIQTDLTPNFYWTEAVDPDPMDHVSYTMNWWGTGDMGIQSIDTDSNGVTPETILMDNSVWEWMVIANDMHDSQSSSDTSYFYSDAFPEPPLNFATVSPENNVEGLGTDVEFVWGETDDPDPIEEISYRVVYASDWEDSSTYVYSETIEDTSMGITLADNSQYYWLVEAMDSDGFIVGSNDNTPNTIVVGTLSIDEDLIPVEFALHQNYPNPFNPVTTLRYDLPDNALVTITIYDMMGREVKTLVNQTQDAGYKSIIWNATNDYGKPVSAGIYLYQIQAGEYISTKKMVLLK